MSSPKDLRKLAERLQLSEHSLRSLDGDSSSATASPGDGSSLDLAGYRVQDLSSVDSNVTSTTADEDALARDLPRAKETGMFSEAGGYATIKTLREELIKREAQMHNMAAEFERKTSALEDAFAETEHEAKLDRMKAVQAAAARTAEIGEVTTRTRREIQSLETRLQEAEMEVPRLRQQLHSGKEEFSNLLISEETFRELSQKHTDDLSVREHVCMQVHTLVHTERDEKLALRQEVANARQQHVMLTDDVERYKLESRRTQERLTVLERESKENFEQLHQKYLSSQRKVTDLEGDLEQYKSKAESYDVLSRKVERLEEERRGLEDELKKAQMAKAALENVKSDVDSKMSDNNRQMELMRVDKEYLQREVDTWSKKFYECEEKLARKSAKARSLKKSNTELYDQILAIRQEGKSEYETQLQEELRRVDSTTGSQIAQIQSQTKEMYERENNALREKANAAVDEAARLKERLATIKESHTQIQRECSKLQSDVTSTKSIHRNELKLKDFEIDRLRLVYEEAKTLSSRQAAELDKSQDKINVLKAEFHALQTKSAAELAEMRSTVTDAQSRVHQYEVLEEEFDHAILSATEPGSVSSDAQREVLGAFTDTLPTANKRRMQHILQLVRTVRQLRETNTELTKDNQQLRAEHDDAESQLNNANDLLSRTQQPYHYLVDSITSKERDLTETRKEASQLAKQVSELKSENKALKEENHAIRADLKKVLGHQSYADSLRAVIGGDASERMWLAPAARAGDGHSSVFNENTLPPGQAQLTMHKPVGTHDTFKAYHEVSTTETRKKGSRRHQASPDKGDQPAPLWFNKLKSQHIESWSTNLR